MRTSLRDGPYLPAGPTADCTADAAGGLTFDVDLPGKGERWDAALLLRPGGPDGDESRTQTATGAGPADSGESGPGGGAVRLPLFPASGGRLRAALPSTMTLAEGRWGGYLTLGEGAPRLLRSGHHDLRSLVGREPSAHRTWLGVRIPYTTPRAGLALRSWLRWPHAEARDLHLGAAALTLHGRLYGAEVSGSAQLEARRRSGSGGLGKVEVVSTAVDGNGGDFRCRLPYAALPGPGDWDLWLRVDRGADLVRVGRILDDVADKHRALSYPPLRLGDHAVTPYWTRSNDLALRLARHPSDAAEAVASAERAPGPARTDTVQER